MIQIKVFHPTPPCAKCKKVKEIAKAVAQKYPGEVEVVEFPALSPEGDKYGIMLTPTVVINDTVVAVGKVISEDELEKSIKKELEEQS